MRRACVAGVVGVALLAGCGGGGSGDSGVAGAVGRWGDAVRAFDSQLRSCGRRVYPTRDFFSACMKQPPLEYPRAAAGVRRAFDARAECSRAAAPAGRILDRDLSLLAQEITFSDDLNNAATDRLSYSGPPLAEFQAQARGTISADLASLRKLSDGC